MRASQNEHVGVVKAIGEGFFQVNLCYLLRDGVVDPSFFNKRDE